ncbi:hypothetical protein RhiirC2_797124 [Rhizophagus irregularis]|uniref:Uncharacterized protein n=1 Tax=Rhizophagus irregularis TaxID=588596 RepID=A0A2N1M8I3_9GLOM|nr:hypothetical protein RhiirC2_797124 [Rhizophagus irregularis]
MGKGKRINPKCIKAFNWVANRPLKDLKETIFSLYQFPELEKNGATLTFSCNEKQYSPQINLEFQNMLQLFVLKRSSKFTVFIGTSLSFSSWTFPKECQLYKLSENSNPLLSVFSLFNCGFVDLDDEKSQEMKYQKVKYVCSYLVAIDNLFEDKFKICPEKNVSDLNGYGPIDFQQGVAQNAVQYESALSNNKKKVFGIITNSESFFWNVHYDSKLKDYDIQKGNLVDYINPLLALQQKSSKDNHTKCSGTTTTEITKNVNNNNLQVNTDLQPSYDNSSPSPSLLVQKPLTEELIKWRRINLFGLKRMVEVNALVDKFNAISLKGLAHTYENKDNNERKSKFKLSKPMVVIYGDKDMENQVKKVLGYIAWLLEKAQKLDELEDNLYLIYEIKSYSIKQTLAKPLKMMEITKDEDLNENYEGENNKTLLEQTKYNVNN